MSSAGEEGIVRRGCRCRRVSKPAEGSPRSHERGPTLRFAKSIKKPRILLLCSYSSSSSKQHLLNFSSTHSPFFTLNHLTNSAKMVSPTKLALIVASALGAVSAVPAAAPSPESSVPGVVGSTVAIADVAEKRDLHKRATVQFQAYENINYGGASLVISVNDNSCCKFLSYAPTPPVPLERLLTLSKSPSLVSGPVGTTASPRPRL